MKSFNGTDIPLIFNICQKDNIFAFINKLSNFFLSFPISHSYLEFQIYLIICEQCVEYKLLLINAIYALLLPD